jgi:hypothetical protein
MPDPMLPTFNGATKSKGCPNPDCEASGRHLRVVSVTEMERVFPQLSEMDFSPLPPQATHVCGKCGYVFSGIRNEGLDTVETDSRPDVDIGEFAWEPEMAYEESVRTATMALIEGAPDDIDRELMIAAIAQHIPGVSRSEASSFLADADREFDAPSISPAEFM